MRGSGSTVENLDGGETHPSLDDPNSPPQTFSRWRNLMSETQTMVAPETAKKTPEVYIAKKPKTADELGELKSFQHLTAKQAQLVLHFIEHGDKLEAVTAVYGLTGEAARLATYSHFQDGDVEEVLDDIAGTPFRERVLRNVLRMARSRKTTKGQIAAVELQARMLGLLETPGKKRSQ
jgi:hypothetical protein